VLAEQLAATKQVSYKSATRVLQECYKGVTRVHLCECVFVCEIGGGA
jgi:hypothetical protein